MKYIRTKDNIVEYDEIAGQFIKDNNWKVADTIEELCDEIVYEILTGEIEEPMYRDIHDAKIDIETQLKIYEDDITSVGAIYGAIWTDNGLIYVAKMNDKGELELL